jgi:hypothetical protein
MAFAMLAGVVVLLGLGLTIAVKMAIDARRDLEHLEDEIADARGLGLNLARDPQSETWSADDFQVLREDVVYEHKSDDPYSTLTRPESWEVPRKDVDRAVLREGLDAVVRRPDVDREVLGEGADRQFLGEDLDKVDVEDVDDVYASSPQESSLESWEIVRDDPDAEEVYEPYTTMTHADSAPSWQLSPRPNGDSEAHPSVVEHPSSDAQPLAAHVQDDPPVVILVVGVGFLGAGGSAVTAASRLRMPRHEYDLSAQAARNDHGSAPGPPLSSFYDTSVARDDVVEVVGRGDSPPERWHDRSTGNGHTNGNASEPDRIAWRPPA